MSKLLMITGDRALAAGKHGAFYNTLEEFHKHWDRIDIICPRVVDQKIKEVFGNVFIHSSPWPLIFQAKFIFIKGRELFKHHSFNLITVHEYPPFYNGIGAWLLTRFIRVPYILEIHHIPGYPRASDAKEWLYKVLTRLFISLDAKKSAAIRVVNQSQVPNFLERSGVSREKIKYIPSLYIDLEVFKPLNLDKKYDLIFIGRLVKNKGIDLFLEVIKKTSLKAIIVGDGPLKNKVLEEKKYSKLENLEYFGWAGSQADISRLINQSRLLVVLSYNEGGPRVVLESLACGVPVIGTPVGIVEDIVGMGRAGFVVNWDVDHVINKVSELLHDAEQYETFKNNGLEIAKRFESKNAIKNYAQHLYDLRLR